MSKGMKMLAESFMYEREYLSPSQIASKYRILSDGNIKGNFEWYRSPYWRYITDCLSPESHYTDIFVEKGSQIGWTLAAIANIMLAIMKQYNGNILFMSDNDDNVKRAMNGFIADMLRESGMESTLGRPKKGSMKSSGGNNANEKKFNGGRDTLFTWSGQTWAKLSSITPKYVFLDEIERYRRGSKVGDIYSMTKNRVKTYQGSHKIFAGSTPEIEDTSIIHPLFLSGDQNYYNIPCPHCGEYITLDFSIRLEDGSFAGITYKRNNLGGLVAGSVGYVCQKCGGHFKESHKYEMYREDDYSYQNSNTPLCLWIPTVEQANKKIGSFHVSSLYSGQGLGGWDQIVENWLDINPINAPKKIDALITFKNQTEGKPWKDKEVILSAKGIMKNQCNYLPGIVPDVLSKEHGNGEIICLMCAVDLNGVMDEKDVTKDDVRLNWSVIAYTEKGDDDFVTSYAVAHGEIGSFERARDKRKREELGESRDEQMTYRHGAKNSVWPVFKEQVLSKMWPTQSGRTVKVMLCGIDTGNYTIYANQFVSGNKNCVGIKGGKKDEFVKEGDIKPYIKNTEQPQLWKVDGNRLKDRVAESIEAEWTAGKGTTQPIGHMNYPMTRGEEFSYDAYFVEYEGEKKKIVKNEIGKPLHWIWEKHNSESRQHYFDCRVYNESLIKIATKIWCKEMKLELAFKNFVAIMKMYKK